MNVVREPEDGPGLAGLDARNCAHVLRELIAAPYGEVLASPRFGQLFVSTARTEANHGSVAAAGPTDRRGRRERGAAEYRLHGNERVPVAGATSEGRTSRSAGWQCWFSTNPGARRRFCGPHIQSGHRSPSCAARRLEFFRCGNRYLPLQGTRLLPAGRRRSLRDVIRRGVQLTSKRGARGARAPPAGGRQPQSHHGRIACRLAMFDKRVR
jgi:hypothetical protein